MGDKSPKSNKKNGKQKSQAKVARDDKKKNAGATPV